MATLPNTIMRVKLLSDRLIGGNHTKQGTVIEVDEQTARSLIFAKLADDAGSLPVGEPDDEEEKPLTAAQKKALAKAEAEAKAAAAKEQAEAEAKAKSEAETDKPVDPLAAAIADAETKKGE